MVLNYLGRDPRSAKREDLAAASDLLLKVRPYIRKFQSQPVTDLVNGNLCLSLGYSGDMTQAQRGADAAGKAVTFGYHIPHVRPAWTATWPSQSNCRNCASWSSIGWYSASCDSLRRSRRRVVVDAAEARRLRSFKVKRSRTSSLQQRVSV